MQIGQILRAQLTGSGIPPSTYIDSGGLNPRSDIAGLHGPSSRQSWELGDMKNPAGSALM